jgi:hypothetical protein
MQSQQISRKQTQIRGGSDCRKQRCQVGRKVWAEHEKFRPNKQNTDKQSKSGEIYIKSGVKGDKER